MQAMGDQVKVTPVGNQAKDESCVVPFFLLQKWEEKKSYTWPWKLDKEVKNHSFLEAMGLNAY